MAEQAEPQKANPRTDASNENIINELTNDLKDSCINVSEENCDKIKDTCVDSDKDITQNASRGSRPRDRIATEECKVGGGDFQEDFDKSEEEEDNQVNEEDEIDEEALKDLEVTSTEEEKENRKEKAQEHKSRGNELFKEGNYRESAKCYTTALRMCPLCFQKERAIMYSNRAAAKMKLELKESAIEDCTKAIELNPHYLKAIFRRAQLCEETDKLDEALADYQKVLELDPLHREALYATKRLPEQIQERNEKLKTEMLGKLKEVGNMILRPFGLSTNNFQMAQDPSTGSYSINFQQNPR